MLRGPSALLDLLLTRNVFVTFKVLKATCMKMAVFWVVAPCGMA
jgi:hypothetical protein